MANGRLPYFLRQGTGSSTVAAGSSSDLTAVRNGTGSDFVVEGIGWWVSDQNCDFKLKLSTNIVNAFQSAGFSLTAITDNYSQGHGGKITLPTPILLGPNEELQSNVTNNNPDGSTASKLELVFYGYLTADS
jgi:hypothetical protein